MRFSGLKAGALLPQSAAWPAMMVSALNTLGGVLMNSTVLYLMEQYTCREYYTLAVPEMEMVGGGRIDESLCKEPAIQSVVAGMHGTYMFIMFTPALFLAGPWGRLSKLLGKKTVLMIIGWSTISKTIVYTAICYHPEVFNIRWIYALPLMDVFGGGPMMLNSLVYTYIAESYVSRDLGQAFYRYGALQLVNGVVGMAIASSVLRISVWLVCLIGIIFITLTLPIIAFLPQHTPYSPILSTPSSFSSEETTSLLSDEPKHSTTKHILDTLLGHYKHSLTLFRDMLASNALSRLTLIATFLMTLTSAIRTIFTQWTSVHYHLSIANVHALSSFEMVIAGSVLLLLPVVAKRYILPRLHSYSRVDLLLACLALGVQFLGIFFMALSPNRVAYLFSISTFTMGAGIMDSIRSFSTGLINDKEQVEKLYIGMGLTTTLGGMAASAGWNWVFSMAMGKTWFAERAPFWGALLGFCFVAVMFKLLGRFAGEDRGKADGADSDTDA